MSAAQSSRRLAAIMFTDMVGYSALSQKDERLAHRLLEEHRRMVRAALAVVGGREVDTTGDGFLLEFQSALQAVHCAILIQQRQAARNAAAAAGEVFQFRVGIHLGEIETREQNIVGDGVNIAARLEPLSPHGGLAISGAVQTLVRNRLDAGLRSIGTPALKNISEPVEVFVLEAQQIAAVQLPQGEPAAAPSRRRKPLLVGVALAGAAAGIVVTVMAARHGHLEPARASDKSVAVLPFSNFSSDRDNEYFAAGIHDSLLTLLARVRDLKVISRTSVMQYKDGARNLREIGKALGVADIVEGSVQKVGNRVRVQAQLIEAATDRHLWAESYDRDLSDVFAIQSEVAQQIVAAVQATLSPQEKQSIERRPTESAEAYDLFLRSLAIGRTPGRINRQQVYGTQAVLEKAIALDPDFAQAHAALSSLHDTAYWFAIDTTPRRREAARQEAEIALRLRPDLPESHFALGAYYLHGFRDYDRAMVEFNEALRVAPNSADAYALIGYAHRRRNEWQAAISSQIKAAELDPRNALTWLELGDTYQRMREYAKAVPAYEKVSDLAPEDVTGPLRIAGQQFLWHGDLAPMEQALAGIPREADPDQTVSIPRIEVALLQGKYAEAAAALEILPRDEFSFGATNFEVPKDFYLASAYTAMGDTAKARPHLLRARVSLQKYIAQGADSPYIAEATAWLGLTQAYLGEPADALRSADEAVRLLPVSKDAMDGPPIAYIAAAAHMRVGETDRALAQLRELLRIPGGAQAYYLQRDPEWQPLWNDPRFKKLIADSLAATPGT